MIRPGSYKASVASHAISETKNGNLQVAVVFSFEAEGSPHTIKWFGSLSEKAIPYTAKSLLVMGLQGNNPAGDLEIGKEVSIVIETEKDDQGKDRNKVKWINALNEIKNVVSQDVAKSKLASLEGAIALARNKLGFADDDSIPF